jgi:hypothetical protein
MGNVPSNQPQPPPAPLSQVAPVCDSACQNAQKLAGLKAAMEQAEATRDSNPEGYEQARIAYFTALKGQGWLAEEKKRIADREIKPVVTKYTDTFNSLTQQDKSQKIFVNLIQALEQEQKQDSEDLRFLNKEFSKDADQANVLNRLAVLNQGETASAPVASSSIFSTLNILYAVIALLGVVVLYLLYSKFGIIKSYFGYGQPTILGGKRVPH